MNNPQAPEQKPDKTETTEQKLNNSGELPIGKPQAKAPTQKAGKKKKIEGAALIGIDVAKEDDFSGWYQQVLLKGDMLDYYDVSGCYILKVHTRSSPRDKADLVARLVVHLGGNPDLVQCQDQENGREELCFPYVYF